MRLAAGAARAGESPVDDREKGREVSQMDYDFSPGEKPNVQVMHVGRERQPVVVADGLLRDPASLVRFASERLRFKQATFGYPGLHAPATDEYAAAIYKAVEPMVAGVFGFKTDVPALGQSFFAIANVPNDRLSVQQLRPHVDTTDPCQLAVLLYLCDESHGGTAFFRFRPTGYETLDDKKYQDVNRRLNEDAQSHGFLPPPITPGDPRLYEQIGGVDSKFNRVVIYRSQMFHSQDLKPTANLSSDPRVGRLTANTFISYPPKPA
jgi:hypothetical protein